MDFKIRFSGSGFIEITTKQEEILLFKDNPESIERTIDKLLVLANDLANYIDKDITDFIEEY